MSPVSVENLSQVVAEFQKITKGFHFSVCDRIGIHLLDFSRRLIVHSYAKKLCMRGVLPAADDHILA